MSVSRRAVLGSVVSLPFAAQALADTPKFTVLLDWFVNPDHAPIFAAKYIGAFEKAGLNVDIVAPTDPDLPPRMVAAGKADMALSYQTQLYLLCDQGLPVRRTGTLINQPLNTLMALGTSGITKVADLKGRKVGYSVAGVDDVLIGTMLASAGLTLKDITLVNVNFDIVVALMSKEVDAVIGGYRNVEENDLKEKGQNPVVFLPEDYGVPASDELIMMSNTASLKDPRLPKFLQAVKQGGDALRKDPAGMWEKFIADQKGVNNLLNKTGWFQSVPYFAKNPAYLDVKRYATYRDFMYAKGMIKHKGDVSAYAVTIAA
ncbi:MAG: thiamine biosynthesis protein [Acidocella sp. 20-57-95]|nr:MAG: thiamine biosynthesis protein [Acidocella sp. 20-57-95]HQT63478.1 ABC transporter substrate-binding protein [Acidocella sp.]